MTFKIIMLPSLPVIGNMGVGERDIGIDSQKVIVLSVRLPLIMIAASFYLLFSSTVACGRKIDWQSQPGVRFLNNSCDLGGAELLITVSFR